MKKIFDALLKQRREAKRQPVTLEELNRRQAYMNSPAWYASIGAMGSSDKRQLVTPNV